MLFADRLEVWNPGRLPSSLTLALLRKPHASVPHNPLLAEPLYLTEYIERMGTGTGDMIRRCKAAGLREPSFAMTDGFVVTIWRAKSPTTDTPPAAIVSGKMSGKTLDLIRQNPDITIPEIAHRLKRTERSIERWIHRLKAAEILGRIGPAKGGRWEILDPPV